MALKAKETTEKLGRVKVIYCHFHSPLFLAGKNFGDKIDAKRSDGIEMIYDRDEKILLVKYKNQLGVVPDVHMYMPEKPMDFGITDITQKIENIQNFTHATDLNKIKNAQVSTPFGHVFAGEGSGKTNQ